MVTPDDLARFDDLMSLFVPAFQVFQNVERVAEQADLVERGSIRAG
jgi:hypothetical protein